MPNNSSDNLDGQEVNAQPFTALLAFLCPEDPNEAINHYLRLHQKLADYFRFKGMSDPLADADEALERAGKKILESVAIPDIDRFCLGIARNIVLENLRKRRKQQSVFFEFLERTKTDGSDVDKITNLMRPCFEKLDSDDRELLKSYCNIPSGKSRADHRRELADSRGWSMAALRIRIMRLRRDLDDCVKALSKNL